MSTNFAVASHYVNLPIPDGKICATYLWVDYEYENKTRSKIRTLDSCTPSISDVPVWTFSKYNSDKDVVDAYLIPVKIFKDPLKPGRNILVLCETYEHFDNFNGKIPLKTNKRPQCNESVLRSMSSEPWFGIEQEYVLMDTNLRPLGWPENGFPKPEDDLPFFNSVGAENIVGRQIAEAHYHACLYAGIKISGLASEVMLSQWEYQLGTLSGIDISDQLIVSRYLLKRIAEDFGVIVSFDPKPVKNWSGSSCHLNFSTKEMRNVGGIIEIENAIEKLKKNHEKHMEIYDANGGEDNKRRLLGTHCAPSTKFISGITKNKCSVRIPRICLDECKGYLEDRRPASNSNPYTVVNAMLKTVILNENS